MDFHLDSLLNLPNVSVFTSSQKEGFILLKLELLNEGINCPHCQTYTDTRLSLDEFSRQKGKRDFVTVVSDIDKGSLLEVINSHKSEAIIAVLKEQPQEMREQVKEVSIDMWGGFPKVIQEVFPKALTVIDRFHVMKLVNQSLNRIRLLLDLKGLKNRCLLLKNSQNLSPKETQELENLLNQSACLRIAYELKEELRHIYETSTSFKMGLRRMKKWLTCARLILGKTADTLSAHLPEICHYFINRTTSGVMEGINNRIKLIIRQSYGFKSFDSLREKLLACLFDYQNS